MSIPQDVNGSSASLSRYVATERGWELDSITFARQVCVDVGTEYAIDSTDVLTVRRLCEWKDDPMEKATIFYVGDKQLGGWSWEAIRHAIENGYSQKFCETMVWQLQYALIVHQESC